MPEQYNPFTPIHVKPVKIGEKHCPQANQYGDIICVDGILWGLVSYSDQRQCLGKCTHSSHKKD